MDQFALYFYNFSTFKGKAGLYFEEEKQANSLNKTVFLNKVLYLKKE